MELYKWRKLRDTNAKVRICSANHCTTLLVFRDQAMKKSSIRDIEQHNVFLILILYSVCDTPSICSHQKNRILLLLLD